MSAGINLARFLLAFNVVIFHIWNAVAPGAGPVAVLAFFYISGYLITQILQEAYATPDRLAAFYLNRFLRIYPQYLGAVLLGLIAIYFFPDSAHDIHSNLSWPEDAREWIPQFAIFGLYDSDVRVLPAAWSLSTELWYYLMIGLATGRSRTLAVTLFAVSLPVALLCALKILPFDFYGHPVGSGFAFAFGSVSYFYRDSVSFTRMQFRVACAAYALHTYAVPLLFEEGLGDANLAGSLVPFSVILAYLTKHDLKDRRIVGWANLLGRLAYPLFLTHWAACVFVSNAFFEGRANRNSAGAAQAGVYFLAVLGGALFLSLLFYRFIDRPVERIRRTVRTHASSQGLS